eukprot:12175681-Alexandrium_andersonii.AAC.1
MAKTGQMVPPRLAGIVWRLSRGCPAWARAKTSQMIPPDWPGLAGGCPAVAPPWLGRKPVSYTHLTLPTIC